MAGAWLEVFKTGKHTSGNGVTKEYTDADLTHIAKTYNEQKDHEAPLVLGHPATDAPAYGWAKELKLAGSKLLAYVDQVSGDIVDAVKRGEYKKVSIALYPDGLLRHIGLLGAVPPAVKGLAPVQFAEGVEFEEYIWVNDETRMPTVARILSSLRDLLIDKFSLDAVDKAIDKNDIAYLQQPTESIPLSFDNQKRIVPPEDINKTPPGALTNYEEQNQQEEEDMEALKAKIAVLEEALAAQSAQYSELLTGFTEFKEFMKVQSEAKTKQAEEDAAKAKDATFAATKSAFAAECEILAKDGKILPAEKEGLIDEYADLLKAEETLTFAEGTLSPSAKMKARLAAREPIFLARDGVFADPKKAPESKLKPQDLPGEYADVAHRVSEVSLDLDKEIREYAEKNKVSYEEAAQAYAGSNI